MLESWPHCTDTVVGAMRVRALAKDTVETNDAAPAEPAVGLPTVAVAPPMLVLPEKIMQRV